MPSRLRFVVVSAVALALFQSSPGPPLAAQSALAHHALKVTLEPAAKRLVVTDRLTLPAGGAKPGFLLNSRLRITRSSVPLDEVPVAEISPRPLATGMPVKGYHFRGGPPPGGVLTIEYEGAMDFGLSDQKEEYTRGFRETTGMVSPEGVYLAGSSYWYPQFGQDLLTFEMDVAPPDGWHVISQGTGTSRGDGGAARWVSRDPMDEIYLAGGPLTVYRDRAGEVDTVVYLHEKDDALASKYLTTTAQYLDMYSRLIGPYPYGKFALVENFWETGYGMPSFTLLGREVIRFPFILHSSYPHEILHNWWGNSVFVEYESGNWAEGLTAYLADHLVQEQRRRGADHRRAALQKYRDYVKDGRDFALTDFRSRDSAATEAVGYGKTLMTFHMLRKRIGDDRFKELLTRLYAEFRGRRASWDDVRKAAGSAGGAQASGFFEEWIARPGAPALEARVTSVTPRAGYTTKLRLAQTQGGQPYHLDVPVLLETETRFYPFIVTVGEGYTDIDLGTPERPLALYVDPYFDLFRRLDPRETPPSISQLFGEPRVIAILPSGAPARAQAAYRELMNGWQTAGHAIEIRLDSEVKALPPDTSIWLLGRENRLAAPAFAKQAGLGIEAGGLRLDGQVLPTASHTAVAITRHPAASDKVVGWIVVDPIDAVPGLGRKLPHYGRYSYVGFEGTEPANVLSGEWKQADSPMRIDLRPLSGAGDAPAKPLPPDPAKPLADLPPIFSRAAMTESIAALTAPAMEGRGTGTKGLQVAADWIAGRFKAYGLQPGGDGGTYLQPFTIARGPDGQPRQAANVIGYLPAARADWKAQSAIVSAHYDHLGRGWPDVHKGDEGRVHPGADDNASGVAVLLDLARALAAGDRPSRNIVFIAFAGEEAGLAGSRHFVASPLPFPLDGVIGVINLDTVGRMFDQRVSVLGTGTASEWQHIFRGASFVTGVESRNVPESIQSSDQVPFVERGIPAVQIFTGAHADYHRPGDTAEKIDADGLVKVAALVREGVAYLAERPEKLTVTIPSTGSGAPSRPASGSTAAGPRRASLGTVPDFAFAGPGVRAEAITEGSPAATAGLQPGDVLVRIDDQAIANLQEYSNLLRTLKPGQTVTVAVRRGEKELTVSVTLAAR